MDDCLIIFAKEPKKGKVKTRLQGYLSESRCLKLYKAFLKDTLNIVKKIKCKRKIIAYDSPNNYPRYLKKIAFESSLLAGKHPMDFSFLKQKGGNLGQRMYNAFKYAVQRSVLKIVIIGSDSPDLPVSFIRSAFFALNDNDVVLGPCEDGGYYLIGLKKPCFDLFKGVEWSGNGVLKQTIKKAKRLKLKIALLKKWLDVDTPESLTRLEKRLKLEKNKKIAQWTRAQMDKY